MMGRVEKIRIEQHSWFDVKKVHVSSDHVEWIHSMNNPLINIRMFPGTVLSYRNKVNKRDEIVIDSKTIHVNM